jgi:hypothetical protein
MCRDIGKTDPSFDRVQAILDQAARVNVLAYATSAVDNVGRCVTQCLARSHARVLDHLNTAGTCNPVCKGRVLWVLF